MASIQDQVSLRSGIASWLNRSDLTDSELDQFIEIAEARLYEELRVPTLETTEAYSVAVSNSSIAIPAGFIEIIELMALEHCRNYIQKDCDLTGQQSRWFIEYKTARYDDLLNIYYKIIIDILKINEDSAWVYIKESQRDWIKLRDNTEKYALEKKSYGRTGFPEDIINYLYRNRTYELYTIIRDMQTYSRPQDKLPSYI